MSSNIIISIIVPIYNALPYLEQCIKSILSQSFSEFELILIDDGSVDGSATLCDEYSTKDIRIKVVHQENGGVTSARRSGVNIAIGEWVMFVDADDTLTVDALSKLYNARIINNDETDIVIGRIHRGNGDDNLFSNSLVPIKEYREAIILGSINCGPTAKLFRRTLFRNNTLDIPRDIVYGEDMLMNIRLAFSTNRDVLMISDIVYMYRDVPESASKTFHRTIEYTQRYDELREDSIPTNERENYSSCLLKARLKAITILSSDKHCDEDLFNSPFYKKIRHEINVLKPSLSFEQYYFLYIKNKILRKIGRRLFRLYNYAHKIINDKT